MSQFEITTSDAAGHLVVALAGECDLAAREALTSALLDAVKVADTVYVDLADLRFLDSSGLHGLIEGYHAAAARGGGLYVVNAAGVVAQVLDLTGVAELLRPPANGDGRSTS